MKKFLMIAMLATGLAATAQDAQRREKPQMTTEQRNELHLKKMTLELDLSAAQQKEMAKVISDQGAQREKMMADRKVARDAKKEMTADEKFNRRKAMMDQKIAMKARMKQILTPEQYAKWESRKGNKMAAREKKGKMKHQAKRMEKK